MAKKDIGKVLTTGSAKQKALLLAEHMARVVSGKEGLVTPAEFTEIAESFKTSREIRLWNEYLAHGKNVTSAINNLQGLKFEIVGHYFNLRGHILVWLEIESAELLANSLLHEVTDPGERKRIARDGLVGVNLLFAQIETDPEGYIKLLTGYEDDAKGLASPDTLRYAFSAILRATEGAIVRYLSWEKALLDYMDETGYNIKTHRDHLKNLGNQIRKPVITWEKYQGKLVGGKSKPALEKLLERYNVHPRIEELEIDQQEYNFFLKVMLGYEK
jgi:hypothetical protein